MTSEADARVRSSRCWRYSGTISTRLQPSRTSSANSAKVVAVVRLRRALGAQPCRSPPEMTGSADLGGERPHAIVLGLAAIAVQLQRVQAVAVRAEEVVEHRGVGLAADVGEIPPRMIEDHEDVAAGVQAGEQLRRRRRIGRGGEGAESCSNQARAPAGGRLWTPRWK